MFIGANTRQGRYGPAITELSMRLDKYTQYNFNRSVLITIDTQNDFTLANAPAMITGTQEVHPDMVRLLALFRNKGLSVIDVIRLYLHDGLNAGLCRRKMVETGNEIVASGGKGAELVDVLKPDQSVWFDFERLLSGKLQKIGKNEFVMY